MIDGIYHSLSPLRTKWSHYRATAGPLVPHHTLKSPLRRAVGRFWMPSRICRSFSRAENCLEYGHTLTAFIQHRRRKQGSISAAAIGATTYLFWSKCPETLTVVATLRCIRTAPGMSIAVRLSRLSGSPWLQAEPGSVQSSTICCGFARSAKGDRYTTKGTLKSKAIPS